MSGSTLMDLITSDPAPPPAAGASSQQPSSGSGGGSSGRSAPAAAAAPAPADRKSKRATLMQIQSDTISAAKAFNPVKNLPQRNRKKKARLLHRRVPHFFSYHLCALFPVSLCILCSPAARLILAAGAEHPRACSDVRPGSLCCFGWFELRDVSLDLLALVAVSCHAFHRKAPRGSS
jgi:hypothetical protein